MTRFLIPRVLTPRGGCRALLKSLRFGLGVCFLFDCRQPIFKKQGTNFPEDAADVLCGVASVFMWVSLVTRCDSLDWKGIPAGQITRRVLDRVQPGSIVLFHNAAEHTPEALSAILESLLNDGYRIVPVSQILLEGDCFIDSTGRQCRR